MFTIYVPIIIYMFMRSMTQYPLTGTYYFMIILTASCITILLRNMTVFESTLQRVPHAKQGLNVISTKSC